MQITFSPQRSDATLAVTKDGDTLVINGVAFDFSVIPEGGILPAAGVECDFVIGDVRREDGALTLTLLLPHGPNPEDAVRFPEMILDAADGVIPLPGAASEE
ncbi:MAG TPA: hypothetical protein VL202_12970 [Pararhizobium sp.]|uniref:hypothetical protein n=1 Tax=Pararhizobium sp. TaxID=1977563 RepID=UPI002CFD52A2|nr:hypothetical protein [Pararhizobium sp.]HTO32074.1 hypothetical protein [Pararhizobium sp.]